MQVTDQQLTDKLIKEGEQFNIRGSEAQAILIYRRLSEVLVELHEIKKKLEAQ